MNRQEILEEIYKYIGNDNARYAIMITGEWGSGKTYLYDEHLEKEISRVIVSKGTKKEKIVSTYISLYGIKTVEQLSKELLTNYILKAKLYADGKKGKIYRVAGGVASIVSKAFSLGVSTGKWNVSADFSKIIEEISKKIDIRRMFICLDDLERCSVPINELFGFINNLVEHCECKVLLLADEENIGKMYANLNIEAKYNTLLMGRKVVNESVNETSEKDEGNYERITIDGLKKLNEKVYSENYVYKDIKEKVIGLTMKYTPDLKEDMGDIICSIVNEGVYRDFLFSTKDKITECMLRYNNNVRIVRNWIIKFEQIYNVVIKNFAESKYYNDVLNEFIVYSAYVACAIGKNTKLLKWTKGAEFGSTEHEVGFHIGMDAYRVVDDLYLDSLFNEERICKAVRYVEAKCIEREERRDEDGKKISTGEMLGKLHRWKLCEDAEIGELLVSLKEEIKRGKYIPQNYQHIIEILVELMVEGLCKEEDINEVKEIMFEKIEETDSEINVENFDLNFASDDICIMFHSYYDPVYEKIVSKNRNVGEKELNTFINDGDSKRFIDYCEKNRLYFTEMKGFMRFVNLENFVKCIEKVKLEDFYEMVGEIEKVYRFYDVHEQYVNDIDSLKALNGKLKELECKGTGITRVKAYKYFADSINMIINKLEK